MSRPRPIRDFALALGFLTVLPIRVAWPEGGARGMVGWFPWVGALLGADAALTAWLLRLAGAETPLLALIAGALVVGEWAFVTRLLHWDGLADTADAVGCHDRSRRLEVMRDSRVGAVGAAAIAIVALVQTAGVAALVESGALLGIAAAPVLGRLAASLGSWTVAPARRDGLGASMQGAATFAVVIPAAIAIAALAALAWFLHGVGGLAVVALGTLAAAALPGLLAREVGGLTGDILGASILLTETATLVAAAFMLR